MKKAERIDWSIARSILLYNLVIIILNILLHLNVFGFKITECDIVASDIDMFQHRYYTILSTFLTVIFITLAVRFKYCSYIWFAISSLACLNIVNLIGVFTNIDRTTYLFSFMNLLILALTFLSVLIYIIEIKKPLPTTSDK